MITDEEITSAVYDVVQTKMGVPRSEIHPNSRLVEDLHLGRDLEFNDLVLPALERRLDVQIDLRGWEKVLTVNDMIELLREQRDQNLWSAGGDV
jgi:acyl carrier protein